MATSAAASRLAALDDDPQILTLLRDFLSGRGFAITTATSGAELLTQLDDEPVDLVLLDLGLPGEDGLELMREIRKRGNPAIIIVSGRGEQLDKVIGLELGADDYVTKPFDLRELAARIKTVLRRLAEQVPAQPAAAVNRRLTFDGWVLDLDSRSLISPAGEPVALTTGEFDLLKVFAEHAQRVLSRDFLMEATRSRSMGPYDRSIDVQIGRLRRKIEADPAQPAYIKSVRSAGYIFSPKVTRR